MIVHSMKALKGNEGIAYRRQCHTAGTPYSSFRRWRSRMKHGHEPAMAPGPKKAPLDEAMFEKSLREVRHGQKRSRGTGVLYGAFSDQISRRELNRRVIAARRAVNRERAARYIRIQWNAPGLVWAMDDCEYRAESGVKTYLHAVQDVSSRYKFPVLPGRKLADGKKVAANLGKIFSEYGPPLFLKRDNGSNLNHVAVDRVLEEHLVIPLNSPAYYAPYNGGIERAQREIKDGTETILEGRFFQKDLKMAAELAVYELNHKKRRCLNGNISCRVFDKRHEIMAQFSRQRRKEVRDTIKNLSTKIAEWSCYNEKRARRLAVEMWLMNMGFINVINRKEVLPYFLMKNCS